MEVDELVCFSFVVLTVKQQLPRLDIFSIFRLIRLVHHGRRSNGVQPCPGGQHFLHDGGVLKWLLFAALAPFMRVPPVDANLLVFSGNNQHFAFGMLPGLRVVALESLGFQVVVFKVGCQSRLIPSSFVLERVPAPPRESSLSRDSDTVTGGQPVAPVHDLRRSRYHCREVVVQLGQRVREVSLHVLEREAHVQAEITSSSTKRTGLELIPERCGCYVLQSQTLLRGRTTRAAGGDLALTLCDGGGTLRSGLAGQRRLCGRTSSHASRDAAAPH